MDVQSAIERLVKIRSTREEIVDYYKELFPQVKQLKNGKVLEAWKSHAASAIADQEGISKDSAMRRFQDRGGKHWYDKGPSREAREGYQELGLELPPILPKGGFKIEVGSVLYVQYSRECEKRTIRNAFTISGEGAEMLAVTFDEQIIINAYNNLEWNEDGYGVCAPPNVNVSPVN